MVKLKLCVVTGTRAEYGLLRPLLHAVRAHARFELQLAVTGTHLSDDFGRTADAITRDGFGISAAFEILEPGDGAAATVRTMSNALRQLADVFDRLKPDLVLILGDRYEMLCVAAAANVFQIPVAHLHGGELTEGAFDDAFRHAITKMSHLHFTATEVYRRRVLQLGEPDDRVFNVGAIGLDNIRTLTLLERTPLMQQLGLDSAIPYFLATYHPQTVGGLDPAPEVDVLCQALLDQEGTQALFTKANADVGGRAINARLDWWADRHPDRIHVFASLGQRNYLSAAKCALAVVGNSSSGIIEVPTFGVPTLDIGDRQRGRIAATSVYHVPSTPEAIAEGLAKVRQIAKSGAVQAINPYGDGHTTERIMAVLEQVAPADLLRKTFRDRETG